MTYTQSNLGSKLIARKYKNNACLSQSYVVAASGSVDVHFSIKPNLERLKKQAISWANRVYLIEGLNLNKNIPYRKFQDPDYHLRFIAQAFIYSYFKCLLCGIFYNKIGQIQGQNFVVAGHQLMFDYLIRQSKQFTEETDIYVSYNLKFTTDDVKFILDMVKSLEFLKEGDLDTEMNSFNFEITKYNKILNHIKEKGRAATDPQFFEFAQTASTSSLITNENYALANSCYKMPKDEKLGQVSPTSWYYADQAGAYVLDKTTLYGKAIFVVAREKSSIGSYYNYVNSDDKGELVKFELTCLADSTYSNPRELSLDDPKN